MIDLNKKINIIFTKGLIFASFSISFNNLYLYNFLIYTFFLKDIWLIYLYYYEYNMWTWLSNFEVEEIGALRFRFILYTLYLLSQLNFSLFF